MVPRPSDGALADMHHAGYSQDVALSLVRPQIPSQDSPKLLQESSKELKSSAAYEDKLHRDYLVSCELMNFLMKKVPSAQGTRPSPYNLPFEPPRRSENPMVKDARFTAYGERQRMGHNTVASGPFAPPRVVFSSSSCTSASQTAPHVRIEGFSPGVGSACMLTA
eukprot:TRINITY_DN204_c0_g1_i1.p1 TRINITY_DN204_c0_g1~~TRINITY_DN204_c0_g1_i1.p1  ORF type:complete len:165 (+),score=13.57 TRINITY_DN204_c0_g1_i1:323-817(+)